MGKQGENKRNIQEKYLKRKKNHLAIFLKWKNRAKKPKKSLYS